MISDIERRNKNFNHTVRKSPDEHETETNSIDQTFSIFNKQTIYELEDPIKPHKLTKFAEGKSKEKKRRNKHFLN